MRGVLPALAWAAGLALQLQQAQLPAPAANAALLGAGLLAAVLAWFWRRRLPGLLLGLCAAALLAFASTNWRAQRQLDQQLAPALDGQDVLVTGVVAEMPRSVPEGQRFVLEVESASQRGRAVTLPPRLSLGWYREPFDDAALTGAIEPMRAGQRWVLPLRVRAVHGTFNPHGFDLELWAFERELGGGGYVRAKGEAAPRKLVEDTGAHPVERLRQQVRDAISTRVADADAAGVLAALAIGDQAAIARDGWDLFRVTGVAHLMSISGLHVTMFAWLAGGLVGALWRRHPRAPLWCPAPLAARWGGLLAATAYALLAGWGVPAQRTLGMIAVVALLRSGGLRWPLHCVLLAAGSVVLLGDPWAMLQPGFWLSFVAVALLVAAEPVRVTDGVAPQGRGARLRATLQGALRTQAVATVGLAPLSLVFFQQLSLVGFVANLLAIPLVTLLITPLALLGMLLPPLWALAAGLVQGLSAFLQLLAAWPLAQWTAAAAPPWAICCGLLGGALAVMPLPWRLRVLALPLVLPLLWPPLQRPAEGQFELVAADVGQGTAVLLRTRSHLLLYDTGPQYSPEADAGGRVLLPLLRGRGEQRVDLLMLSHRDSDHVGGAATVLAGAQVVRISSSLADDHLLHAAAPPHGRCEAGQRWQWDGVQFAVLHPQAQAYGSGAKSNAMSCVLHVQGQGRSVLLTGDIEAPQEAALLARDAAALRADVLLVPHHGSRTSSTAAFIAAVQPRVAVVQAAWRSRFGHPAPDVVARYLDSGVTVVRTDRCGAWALSATGFASCERQRRPRYWHHHLEAQTEP
jgi:competence protein ComEC